MILAFSLVCLLGDDEIEREENSGMDEEQKREAVALLCECGSTITATRHIKDVARNV